MNILASARALQLWEPDDSHRPKGAWHQQFVLALLASITMSVPSAVHAEGHRKLDPELSRRAASRRGTSRVVVRLAPGATLPTNLRAYVRGNRLQLIDAYVLTIPDSMLSALDNQPEIASAHQDREAWAADYLSTKATGADVAQDLKGLAEVQLHAAPMPIVMR